MKQTIRLLMGLTVAVGTFSFALLSPGTAEPDLQTAQRPPAGDRPSAQSPLPGRGVAHGALFNQGRNVNTSLTIDGDNFGYELTESSRTPTRVQYRGVIVRQNGTSANGRSFTLDTRVRSFDTTANLRVLNNTTGTCRIEVFNSRVISSNCTTVSDNSSTRFLGLEQF